MIAEHRPLFVSKREQHLWFWTGAVIAAIFSTLALASTLAPILNDGGLFGVGFFLIGCALVLATVITQGLRVRPSGVELFVATGIAAAYLLVLVRMAIPTERSHLIEYGVLAIFIHEAFRERTLHGRRVPAYAWLAILAASLVGVIDECVQYLLPSRVFDPVDMIFNTVAAFMAVASSAALSWARRRTGNRSGSTSNS